MALAALALVGAVFFAGFIALGIWQVQRLSWKLDLIERVAQRITAAPSAPPPRAQWATLNMADH
ncbi:MAG: SURF1 family protein, partial [Burkholderiaceae bacterium]|nr:SURF1 family protein [Burkholderiaceae bacterium]